MGVMVLDFDEHKRLVRARSRASFAERHSGCWPATSATGQWPNSFA
jgi:hypothetical protein